jgi:hypothetical protein
MTFLRSLTESWLNYKRTTQVSNQGSESAYADWAGTDFGRGGHGFWKKPAREKRGVVPRLDLWFGID